jgi:hypothetical protein
VNIGLVVFLDATLDVRFAELQKLRALTGRDWEQYIQSYRARANALALEATDEVRLKALGSLNSVIIPSSFGWLEAADSESYEQRVREIMRGFIERSGEPHAPREPRINTEIALAFRRHKILAKAGDDLASHKVVRNVEFPHHRGLKADFVLKNGAFHVTATLDLRKINVRLDEACLKAVVLDKAKHEFEGDKRLFGVYAVPPADATTFKDHIDLLRDYADEIFNWSDPSESTKYQHRMYDALRRELG